MDLYSGYINTLIDELAALPGIGSKSAQRLAFHLINLPEGRVRRLSEAILQAKQNVRYCRECFTLTDSEICPICKNEQRDHNTIMVVENTRDLAAYEKTGKYQGVYHVLHGAISPMEGRGADQVKVKELLDRVQHATTPIKEVIIATDPDSEGETTALYLADLLRGLVDKITRIGYGVPLGGDIDYIDEMTLGYSLKGRTKL